MRFVGLAAWLDARADAMPYGALKRLEIARALATRPSMLLLDEPAAGLNPTETSEIDALIGQLSGRGLTVVLVEHNMRLVMGVSDRILVLDYGRKLAEGSAGEVRSDPRVIEAYLGSDLVARSDGALTMLEIRALESRYGRIPALKGIDLSMAEGELVALVGANGAGKTTLLRALSGVQRVSAGQVRLRGRGHHPRALGRPRAARASCRCPRGGRCSRRSRSRTICGSAPTRAAAAESDAALERVYEMFPVLKSRRRQPAGTLSGGQQQMLAMGRGLMAKPRLLLLDEPSMGLAPKLVAEIFAAIRALQGRGHDDLPRGPERARRALGRRSRLRARDRAHRALGLGRATARRRAGEGSVSRLVVAAPSRAPCPSTGSRRNARGGNR